MDREQLEHLAWKIMGGTRVVKDRETGYVYHHGLRTARISQTLADAIGADVDRDILFAGALFHDVAKGDEPHHQKGAAVAEEVLSAVMPPDDLALVQEIVRGHNQRGRPNPHPTAVQIVQDADLLDHQGPQGVWLQIRWNAAHDETVEESVGYVRSKEFADEIAELRSFLNFEPSREAFDRRVAFFMKFFNALWRSELGELK